MRVVITESRSLLTEGNIQEHDAIVGAIAQGRLLGIAHFLFHASVWNQDECSRQDVYVREDARGRGIAFALIRRVAGVAARRAARLYWHAKKENPRARRLYDQIGVFSRTYLL